MDVHQQMDSGTNKNFTNDRQIIWYCSTMDPIPIFGSGNDDAACHIKERGITSLGTVDEIDIDIIMHFSGNCSGTIITPNAIVQDRHSPVGLRRAIWTQVLPQLISIIVQFSRRIRGYLCICVTIYGISTNHMIG